MSEIVTVVAGGRAYPGWEKVSVKAAIDEAARTFELSTTERPGEFNFPPGTPVAIMASGTLMVRGYVNRYNTSGAATKHDVKVSGRGKGQDFVDSSATHPTGREKNMSAAKFAQKLDKFGVGINDRLGLPPVPYQQIRQGESCHDCIERYLRPHGAVMMGNPDGSIDITNASVAKSVSGALIEGQNIKEWTVNLSDDNKHSEYTVKGQNRHGTGAENLRIKEIEKDPSVRRYRPKVMVSETDTDKGRAKKRAKNQKDRNGGEGVKASVTVQGWRSASGALWTPNTIVYVFSPTLMHLVQPMLIQNVDFSQDNSSGTIAKLSLIDPRAYKGKGKGKPGKKNSGGAASKSDPAWSGTWT